MSEETSESFNATASAISFASEMGVDLHAVTGTGVANRITKRDIENYLESNAAVAPTEEVAQAPVEVDDVIPAEEVVQAPVEVIVTPTLAPPTLQAADAPTAKSEDLPRFTGLPDKSKVLRR
jgi:pyruvate/2-oxoglutarate dehydrogenase complex dihydrolipoamide acyltransferase (E2) component